MLQEDISKANDNFERYKDRISNFSGDFELGLFLFIARKSLIWVILLFVIAFFSALLYLRYTPPIFESHSTLQIQTSNQATDLLNVSDFGENKNVLSEDVELLRSKVLFKRVLSKLPLENSYFAEGTFKANELYSNSPFSIVVKIKNSTIANSKIYVDFLNTHQVKISYEINETLFSKTCEVEQWNTSTDFDFNIHIKNYKQIEEQQNLVKKNSYFFTINNLDNLVEEYYPRLDVKILNANANTILITFSDFNAQKATDIVTTITNEYDGFEVERKSQSSGSIIEFINEQLDVVYEKLKASENSIREFKKEYSIGENSLRLAEKSSRHNAIEDKIIALELEESVLIKIETNINNSKNINTYSLLAMLAGTNSETSISSSINALQKLLLQKEEMLYNVTPNSEATRAIDYQIEIQTKLLKESIKSIKNNIQTRKEDLKAKAEEIDNKFHELPENVIEYNRLQRLFDLNEKYYTMLIEKKTEYSISKAGFVTQNVILEKATVSGTPISPNNNYIYLTYLLSAFLLSIAYIIIRYLSHDQINSLNDISKHLNTSISILGIVPKSKQDIPSSQLLVDKSPKSIIAESFRSIRTNLQFISNQSDSKVIAITSTISGEGKTFVAINLAGIIAFSGKKVILIDLDMRRPKIHIGFKAENTKGMSTLLIKKDTLQDCIQDSSLENLHFITAGPIPPNPSELVISKRMDELIAELKTMYDIIMIDTPPVGLVSDGITMIQKADFPIYIFRSDYSKRNFIHNADRLYNEANIKKLSIILNGIDIERKSYGYSYGYGYGYGYGSGYGYYDEDTKGKAKKTFFKK
jgi:capsular exopolysaccharide synthesis family protein